MRRHRTYLACERFNQRRIWDLPLRPAAAAVQHRKSHLLALCLRLLEKASLTDARFSGKHQNAGLPLVKMAGDRGSLNLSTDQRAMSLRDVRVVLASSAAPAGCCLQRCFLSSIDLEGVDELSEGL